MFDFKFNQNQKYEAYEIGTNFMDVLFYIAQNNKSS